VTMVSAARANALPADSFLSCSAFFQISSHTGNGNIKRSYRVNHHSPEERVHAWEIGIAGIMEKGTRTPATVYKACPEKIGHGRYDSRG